MREYSRSANFRHGMERTFVMLSAILMLLLLTATASALYTIQELGTDGFRYLNGTNISVSGKLMNGTAGERDANITLLMYNQSSSLHAVYNIRTDSNGLFSKVIKSNLSGRYSIIAFAPDINITAPGIDVIVYESSDIKYTVASFTIGQVYSAAIDAAGNGSAAINGTPYYFHVSSSNAVSIDNDPNINTTEIETPSDGFNAIGNLATNSRIKLGNNTHAIFFVNRTNEIVLARTVHPVFSGSENYRNLTILALNASDHPLSGKTLLINISNNSGILGSQIITTDSSGIANANISISRTGGIYTVKILEGSEPIGTATYTVNSYDVAGEVLSSEWSLQHVFAKRQNATLAVSVKTTAGAIINSSQASVTAYLRGPGGSSSQHSLSFDTNRSLFYYVYRIPDSAAQGTYIVEYVTSIGSETLRSYSSFDVRGYSLYLKPISNKIAELEGFFPGEQGYLLVTGTNLDTGEIANLDQLTGNSNRSNFTFSIKNSEGKDTAVVWDVMNLSTFFSSSNVDPWLQDEIRARAPNASVVSLTAPLTEGIYDARVSVSLEGSTETAGTSLGVQSIFLYGFPVSSEGSPAMSVSSQDNVTLRIEAFNPRTMSIETNISAVGITEVFAMDAGEIVTEKMLNPIMVALPDGSKGLRFYNNDTNMGFHMVKFWANVTISSGNSTQAIGTGFFDARQYLIWATPALTNNGNFKTFTANSDISLRVRVMNTGFSPQSGKQVSIDEVRYAHTWEKINFDTLNSSNSSGTTDSSGIANLSFTPSSSMKSGRYDVKIRLTTTDSSGSYVTDYGRGWFEVKNFMFLAKPENWNVKSGGNVSFRMQTVNASNMNTLYNSTVRVSKVFLRTDWIQPPTLVEGPHTLNGAASVNISTNASQYITVNYTGGKTTRSGMYEFIFEATSGNMIEEARSIVESRPFVAWVSLPGGIWNNRFGVNKTINLIVHASDDYWGGTAIKLDANRTNITSVTKMGMFGGTPYKKQSELNITSVALDADGNSTNITLSLTNWQEGDYDMLINAVDINGNEVMTHFWVQIEVATAGLPEFYRVWLPEGRSITKKVSFNLTDTPSEKINNMDYPGLDNVVASNFSSSKIGHNISFLAQRWEMGAPKQREFWALLNLTEMRLYVNYNNANFSDTNASYTQNMTAGDIFNEKDGAGAIKRRWNVTSITSDGTVVIEGIDTLANGYIIDPSLSKSGAFITSSDMQDSEWLKVDLDGNGYQRDWDPESRNNTYYILLADNTTSGVYDTVWVSNKSDFTGYGINATNGSTGITFGGAPIYFISVKKQSSGYEVLFTSYTTGWGSMHLGTFEKDKKLRIPFLVLEPGTTTGISGANVEVDKLTWYAPGSEIYLSGMNDTTNAQGLAIVELDTTNIPTGGYLISYRVTLPDGYTKSSNEKWRLPGLEIRKFLVNAEFGSIGSISTQRISNGNGLTVLHGSQIEPRGAITAYHWGPVYRAGWPFDQENEYYYNASDGRYYGGFDFGNQTTTGSPINNNSINLTKNGVNTTYNFTQFIQSGQNVSLTGYEGQNIWNHWNISIWGGGFCEAGYGDDGSPWVKLRIDYLLDNEQNNAVCPPQNTPKQRTGSRIFWGPGQLDIEITDINLTPPGRVNFTLFQPKILYQSESLGILLDGNEVNGEWMSGSVTRVSYKGYDVYGYNDRNYTMMENPAYNQGGWGWSQTLDRVLVMNSTWSGIYRIGQRIAQLDNEYVGLVANWGGKIVFVNHSTRIFPLSDWAPDGDAYYVGTFTEPDVKVDLNNNFTISDNVTYFIRLEDLNPNGVFNVTNGMYDDDTDFTQAWGSNHSPGQDFEGPLDMYSLEQGQIVDIARNNRLDERWINIGSLEGWPFGVPEISYNGNYANLTTFKPRWEPFDLNENVTMYVSARTFSNQHINGNITLDRLIVMFKSNMSDGKQSGPEGIEGKGQMAPEVYEIPNLKSPIINGIGVFKFNYTSLSSVVGSFDTGNFVAKLNITDAQGNFEIVERSFMMQNRSAFGKNEYGCPPPPAPCGGGGGG